MYEYQHYPLAMYRNGEYIAVANEAEEQAMKSQGWSDWYTDKARCEDAALNNANNPNRLIAAPVVEEVAAPEQKRKPGRPRKNG